MFLDTDAIKCPIREILGRVGGRWTIDVLMQLEAESHHFADLDRCIPNISRRMLTLTLRGLERDGLLVRLATGTAGSMVYYEITELGKELATQLHILTEWSRTRRDAIYAARDSYDRNSSVIKRV
jgi:DNA-binding HxlR family transcriptional regulator